MWDLITEYLTSLLESDFVVWSFVGLWIVGSWYFVTCRCAEDDPSEEHSYYVDPAYPRLVPKAPHDETPTQLQRGARVSDSRTGTYSESGYETTGLSRPSGDAA